MKGRVLLSGLLPLGLVLALAAGMSRAETDAPGALVGTAFTYQGRLTDTGGPVTANCDFTFELYDQAGSGVPPSGGTLLGTDSEPGVEVVGGLFTVRLDFGSDQFKGEARWLQIEVDCGSGAVTLAPRQELTPAPYALALPGLWTQQNATSPNLLGGHVDNWITAGVAGGTIGGGGSTGSLNRVTDDYGTVGGGGGNQAGNADADTGNASYSTVGGGQDNQASGQLSTVGGGSLNVASGTHATISGGNNNRAAPYASVGGGSINWASGSGATIGGGGLNAASGTNATISGGVYNEASGTYATVGGGQYNHADANYATVGGGGGATPGQGNKATAEYGTVGGGRLNTASGADATIGGGASNTASLGDATVGGGEGNTASGACAVVAGGCGNVASQTSSTVAGGGVNYATAESATVGGGSGNTADHSYATVPGGRSNYAGGSYGFAAGRRAKVYHQGSFVWADSTDADFASTTTNQFRVRAYGGAQFYVDGKSVFAEGNGGARWSATMRANNTNTSNGMAAYMTNDSTYATAHFANGGSGQVLWLENGGSDAYGAGGGDFITAVNDPESDVQFRVNSNGAAWSDVGFNTPASDLAEMLPAIDGLEPGDVLVVGSDGRLARSSQPYQASVVGVYSTRPGFVGGQPVEGELAGHIPLAVIGIVPVKASTENGAIHPGDLLVSSSTPGYAMRASPITVDGISFYPSGVLIGKALEGLDASQGTGIILMLVTLQ